MYSSSFCLKKNWPFVPMDAKRSKTSRWFAGIGVPRKEHSAAMNSRMLCVSNSYTSFGDANTLVRVSRIFSIVAPLLPPIFVSQSELFRTTSVRRATMLYAFCVKTPFVTPRFLVHQRALAAAVRISPALAAIFIDSVWVANARSDDTSLLNVCWDKGLKTLCSHTRNLSRLGRPCRTPWGANTRLISSSTAIQVSFCSWMRLTTSRESSSSLVRSSTSASETRCRASARLASRLGGKRRSST
mmetsp:Transcript_14844/g.56175  ORF Transcript_14844/g.56175 Transcript_14844/m.56175 type:complete len:243 (+) Transcript_14844:9948-10676(+)